MFYTSNSLIPSKFPMNWQQICKAIRTCSHCCHCLHVTKPVWNVFSFDEMSPLERSTSAFQTKIYPLNFLLVSLYLKTHFHMTPDTSQSKETRESLRHFLPLPACRQRYCKPSTETQRGCSPWCPQQLPGQGSGQYLALPHTQQSCELSSYSLYDTGNAQILMTVLSASSSSLHPWQKHRTTEITMPSPCPAPSGKDTLNQPHKIMSERSRKRILHYRNINIRKIILEADVHEIQID